MGNRRLDSDDGSSAPALPLQDVGARPVTLIALVSAFDVRVLGVLGNGDAVVAGEVGRHAPDQRRCCLTH
jgi:hypothetical protein